MILILSCESELYPPTDPPELSDLILTSSSYTTSTTKAYQGDTVFLTVAVEDPEDDPERLILSIISADGTEAASEEYGESRIHDGTSWEGWFETEGLAVGSYSLDFTAVDKEGNESDTLSQSFDIETNIKANVTTADITISAVSVALKDEIPDQPYTITFTVSNNSAVKIDQVLVPFTVTVTYDNGVDAPIVTDVKGIGVVLDIGAGEDKIGHLSLNIQLVNITTGAPVYSEADCTIRIY